MSRNIRVNIPSPPPVVNPGASGRLLKPAKSSHFKNTGPGFRAECLDNAPSVVDDRLQQESTLPTRSLSDYVRQDLTTHVTGWETEQLEKRADTYGKKAFELGHLQYARLSGDLKVLRSEVRKQAVEVTSQDVRLTYLDKQVSKLEDHLKKKHHFMSE